MEIQKRSKRVALQAATTITAAETAIGGEQDCETYTTAAIWVDYTNGDETSYDIVVKFAEVAGMADEYQTGYWSTGAIKTWTTEKFRMTATGKYYIVLDITGIARMKVYGDATGGTPTGTAQVSITLTS